MNKKGLSYLLSLAFVFLLSGCVVRSYPLTRDRVDQDVNSGNRGYVKGAAASDAKVADKRTTRTTQVVEIEMHSPIKFEKMPKAKPAEKTQDEEIWGNRGYITKSQASGQEESMAVSVTIPSIEKYTVQKNDTLQKISKKFYGTTKKWLSIYEANQDVLKGPNNIYPGQVLNIPLDHKAAGKGKLKTGKRPLEETEENLK
jgi:LysM repeat protein